MRHLLPRGLLSPSLLHSALQRWPTTSLRLLARDLSSFALGSWRAAIGSLPWLRCCFRHIQLGLLCALPEHQGWPGPTPGRFCPAFVWVRCCLRRHHWLTKVRIRSGYSAEVRLSSVECMPAPCNGKKKWCSQNSVPWADWAAGGDRPARRRAHLTPQTFVELTPHLTSPSSIITHTIKDATPSTSTPRPAGHFIEQPSGKLIPPDQHDRLSHASPAFSRKTILQLLFSPLPSSPPLLSPPTTHLVACQLFLSNGGSSIDKSCLALSSVAGADARDEGAQLGQEVLRGVLGGEAQGAVVCHLLKRSEAQASE